MASIFSRIVLGEIPAYKVAETEHCLAFLDINPLMTGHTLVIPKKEVDFIFDLEEEAYLELMDLVRKVGRAIHSLGYAKRVGVAVIGLEVPHAHVHLVPINELHDLDFSRPKLSMDSSAFQKVAADIIMAMQAS
ncbi:MAG TPA: HIT domain-containing protein [Bacteroidales bacterium]|nr:HIT domain-containing protein [Bacteroidales bacterium]